MPTLVVGASGATGSLLVEQLLQYGQHVRAVVRSADRSPPALLDHEQLTVIEASIYDASEGELAEWVEGCDAIASCLGHNLSFKGVFGHPRRLVRDATRRLCNAVMKSAADAANQSNALGTPSTPTKFVLMNTAGNSNRDLNERISLAQRCVIQLLRWGLPPHRDNELAADYLRTEVGQDNAAIEWAVVRPDTLTNDTEVTPYQLHASPTRSAIFNAGETSRINTAHFMAQLIVDDAMWETWRGKMPVIYNAAT